MYYFDLNKESDKKVSNHFKASEFMCPHCKIVKVNPELLIKIEKLRQKIGNIPIKITSGYRCPTYNKEIGGYFKSRHIEGDAADLRPWNKSKFNYYKLVSEALKIFPRVGVYQERFIHVDLYDEKGNLYWYKDKDGYHYTKDMKEVLRVARKIHNDYKKTIARNKKEKEGDEANA